MEMASIFCIQTKANLLRSVMLGAAVFIVGLAWTDSYGEVKRKWNRIDYDDLYSPFKLEKDKQNKALFRPRAGYRMDIHAWVYTSEFTKHFTMPERWVDNSLKGAMALAYRVQWQTGDKCGLAGEMEADESSSQEKDPNCKPRVKCVLDIYFDNKTQLPFRSNIPVDQDPMRNDHSARWLVPQSQQDKAYFHQLSTGSALKENMLLLYLEDNKPRIKPINSDLVETRIGVVTLVSTQIGCDVVGDKAEARRVGITSRNWKGYTTGETEAEEIPASVRKYKHMIATKRGNFLKRIYIPKPGSSYAEIAASIEKQQTSSKKYRPAKLDSNLDSNKAHIIEIPNAFVYRAWAKHAEWIKREDTYYDEYPDAAWLQQNPLVDEINYEAKFTSQANQPFDKDVNLWAYTEEFARRFGMPKKWIYPDLGDAEAIAYRIEEDTVSHCQSAQGCKQPNQSCYTDLYLKGSATVPWSRDIPVANLMSRSDDSSAHYLHTTNETLHWHIVRETAYDVHVKNPDRIGLGNRIEAVILHQTQYRRMEKGFLGILSWSDWHWSGGANYNMRYWDRRFGGLILIGLSGTCASTLHLDNPQARRYNQARDTRIIFSKRGLDISDLNRNRLRVKDGNKTLEIARVVVQEPDNYGQRQILHSALYHRGYGAIANAKFPVKRQKYKALLEQLEQQNLATQTPIQSSEE